MNLVKEKQGGSILMGLKRWPLKLQDHLSKHIRSEGFIYDYFVNYQVHCPIDCVLSALTKGLVLISVEPGAFLLLRLISHTLATEP